MNSNTVNIEKSEVEKRGAILIVVPVIFLLFSDYDLFILFFVILEDHHPFTGLNIHHISPFFFIQGFVSSLILLFCSIGLFARQNWARLLYFIGTPFSIILGFIYIFMTGNSLPQILLYGLTSILGYAIFSFFLTRKHVKEYLL